MFLFLHILTETLSLEEYLEKGKRDGAKQWKCYTLVLSYRLVVRVIHVRYGACPGGTKMRNFVLFVMFVSRHFLVRPS